MMLVGQDAESVTPLLAALVAAVVLVSSLALSGSSEAAAEGEELTPAELYEPAGLSPQLSGAAGSQRVRLLLRAQPLVQAAARPGIRQLIEAPDTDQLKTGARANPAALGGAEKREALGLEQGFERAVGRLEDDAEAAVAEVESIGAVIAEAGGRVIESGIAPASIVARIPASKIQVLADRRDVQAIVPSPRPRPLLDFATPSTGAPDWWAAGYDGGEGGPEDVPVDVGLLSEAPEPTHPAFVGVGLEDVGGGASDHGTHVGGVVASQGDTFKGGAPGIDTLLGGTESRLLGFADTVGSGTSDPAEVLNLSFGSPASDDNDDSPQDVLVSLFGTGYAAASGNENVDGTPTVNNIGRNHLIMAGYNDLNNTSSADDVILGISSRGPTPAGRKKPDLTAPAGSIESPDLLGGVPNGFTGVTGTSFSSPFGASAMALLAGAAIGDPKAQRAILINSARDWDGAATGITNGWIPGSQGSWQPEVGWGVLDLAAALTDRGNYEMATVEEGSARFFAASPGLGAKTTLAWELRGTWDGYPALGVNPLIYTTSNLDLRQYDANTMAEIAPPADPGHGGGPDAVDDNDTVEQVRAGSAGLSTIYKVESSSTIEGLNAEPFAIAGTEPVVPLVNPEVEPFNLSTDAIDVVNCSTDVLVQAQFKNDSGDFDAEAAKATLKLPVGVELISGPQTQTVSGGTLDRQAGAPALSWLVRASTHGTKELTIEGSGSTLGETFTDTEGVSFTADCSGPRIAFGSGPGATTTDRTPTFAFNADEPAAFDCSLDDGEFVGCTSPHTASPLALGKHSFHVRGTDASGNLGATVTHNLTVVDRLSPEDTTRPNSSIDSGPDGRTSDQTPTFTFSADEPATFECQVRGNTPEPCVSAWEASKLASDRYTMRVWATDAAGNREAEPATRVFTVDSKITDWEITARSKQRQAKKRIAVRIRGGAGEPTKLEARGKILIGGRDVGLRPQAVKVKTNRREALMLVPRRRYKDGKRVRRAIDGGRRPRAKLTVGLLDQVGNLEVRELKVHLR